MKVYLHVTNERGYLFNENYTMFARPQFVTSPKRKALLKVRYNEETMDNIDLLCTITNEDLQQLVGNVLLKWRLAPEYLIKEIWDVIATIEVKAKPSI